MMRRTALLVFPCVAACLVGEIRGGAIETTAGQGDATGTSSSSTTDAGPGSDPETGTTTMGDGGMAGESAASTDGGETTASDTASATTEGPFEVIPEAPLLHLQLDEGMGLVPTDSSGNAIPCVLEGAAEWATGKDDGGVRFDDALPDDNYVSCDHTLLDELNRTSFSLALWVMPLSLPLNADENTNSFGLIMRRGFHTGLTYRSSGAFAFEYWDATQKFFELQSGVFAPKAWHHVAVTVDSTANVFQLYVDGVVVDAGDTGEAEARDYGSEPWYIGIAAPGAPTYRFQSNAVVDHVLLYDRALTPDEIALLANP